MSNETRQRPSWPSYVSLLVSIGAILISFVTPYYTILKPAFLEIKISPEMSIQHRDNFGVYLNVDFRNDSPQGILIRQICLILSPKQTPDERYLLEMRSFRTLDSIGITYTDSHEQLPLPIPTYGRANKTIAFVYNADTEFPISPATYKCEILVWTDEGDKASFRSTVEVNIDNLTTDEYSNRRKANSTTLLPVQKVGYTPPKSRKLTKSEYQTL